MCGWIAIKDLSFFLKKTDVPYRNICNLAFFLEGEELQVVSHG